jgi:hypothetical protein
MFPDDDGTINLRNDHGKDVDDAEFKINSIDDSSDSGAVGNLNAVSISEFEEVAMKPHDKVKIKFDKFVNLVASHAYEEVFDKHVDDDVIINTNLLTDLANAHEEKQDKKMPVVFLVGIVLGIVLTWILLRT